MSENSRLPSALVLTGLEHCGVPCHRALLHTLLESRVTFGENLDGAEPSSKLGASPAHDFRRPYKPSARLDRFSLSVAVALHPACEKRTRHTMLPTSLER